VRFVRRFTGEKMRLGVVIGGGIPNTARRSGRSVAALVHGPVGVEGILTLNRQ
jgi:hypothetical protein